MHREWHITESWRMDRKRLHDLSGGHEKDGRFASYSLRGLDVDPDEITRLTGLSPDRAWRIGDPRARTGLPYKFSNWEVDSGLSERDEIHDHLDALLGRLGPAWSTFVELGQRYGAFVFTAIYVSGAEGPVVTLLPDVANALSELNATLDFDLYAFASAGEDSGDAGPSSTW